MAKFRAHPVDRFLPTPPLETKVSFEFLIRGGLILYEPAATPGGSGTMRSSKDRRDPEPFARLFRLLLLIVRQALRAASRALAGSLSLEARAVSLLTSRSSREACNRGSLCGAGFSIKGRKVCATLSLLQRPIAEGLDRACAQALASTGGDRPPIAHCPRDILPCPRPPESSLWGRNICLQ